MSTKHTLQTLEAVPVCIGTGFIALDIVVNKDDVKAAPKLWTGGSCGNVLTILSYLGWTSYPIARLGKDVAAKSIRQDLKQFRVKLDFIDNDPQSSTPVIIEQIFIGSKGTPKHRFQLECPSCGFGLPRYKAILVKKVSELLNKTPVASTFYFDRVSPASLRLANAFRSKGSLIVFEPSSIGNEKLFQKAVETSHILKYSSERLGHIDILSHEESLFLQVETLGSEGLQYRLRNKQASNRWSRIPAFNISDIKDAAGSGDWCTAGMIHLLGRNGTTGLENILEEDVVNALNFGQALAALNCGFEGARGGMYSLTKDNFKEDLKKFVSSVDPLFDYIEKNSSDIPNNLLTYACPSCQKIWSNVFDYEMTEDITNNMPHCTSEYKKFGINCLHTVL